MIPTLFTSNHYLSDLRDALFTEITHVLHVYVCISTQNHVHYAFVVLEDKIEYKCNVSQNGKCAVLR